MPNSSNKESAASFKSLSMRILILVVFDFVVAIIVTSFPIYSYYMRFARKYQCIAQKLMFTAPLYVIGNLLQISKQKQWKVRRLFGRIELFSTEQNTCCFVLENMIQV